MSAGRAGQRAPRPARGTVGPIAGRAGAQHPPAPAAPGPPVGAAAARSSEVAASEVAASDLSAALDAAPAAERLVVGLVRGLHGLRGAIRVEVLTDRPEARFAPGSRLHPEGSEAVLTVVAAEPDGRGWRLRFAEVPDRTAAESLRDAYLEVEAPAGGGLARGEYWWHEIVGAAVRDLAGAELGVVRDVYRAGGAEVLVVRGPRGELDVPVVRSVVRIFAPRRGEIVVDAEALGLEDGPDEAGDADADAAAAGDGDGAKAAG